MKQMTRFLWAGGILVTILLLALPAFAGGWAVATLDTLPDYAVAGQPLTIGFIVRQHGVTPLDGLSPAIRIARPGEYGEVVASATDDGGGHYSATFTFPESGEWNWVIETGFWPEVQPMPALIVLAGGEAAVATIPTAPSASPFPFAVGIAGIVGAAGGLLILARTKAPWAAAVALVAAVVSVMGFASASTGATASASEAVAPPVVALPERSQVEVGQRLFVAKGCVVCHQHDAVADVKKTIGFSMDDVPDLTNFSANADYLAKWLDDPQSIKPKTYMPQLNLSDGEITALVAFINAP
jgi:cytochrome c551/c552